MKYLYEVVLENTAMCAKFNVNALKRNGIETDGI